MPGSCSSLCRIRARRPLCSWPELQPEDTHGEYGAFLRITSDMIWNGADRASVLVSVAGAGGQVLMAIRPMAPWRPLEPDLIAQENPTPFEIGAMGGRPMVSYEGQFRSGVDRLAGLPKGHFGDSLFPVGAVDDTGNALGYGSGIHSALAREGLPLVLLCARPWRVLPVPPCLRQA